MPTLTRRDVALFSLRHGLSLMPEEIDAITDSANLDTEEGAEWLPWYKAALGVLAELTGHMHSYLESGVPLSPDVMANMKRAWMIHLWLIGIGPSQDAEANAQRKAFAEGEANAAFYALEEKVKANPPNGGV